MALSDPQGILASPLTIINREDDDITFKAIIDIIDQKQVGQVVAGLPLSMDGSVSQQAEKVKAFVTELRQYTEVPVEFRDERLSTVSAKRMVREVRKIKKKTRYDAMAAAIILQGYLDETY